MIIAKNREDISGRRPAWGCYVFLGMILFVILSGCGALDKKAELEHSAKEISWKTLKHISPLWLEELIINGYLDPNTMIEVSSGDKHPPLAIVLIHNDDNDVVDVLIKHGADINGRLPYGWSLLQLSTYYANLDAMESLLRSGAKVEPWEGTHKQIDSFEIPLLSEYYTLPESRMRAIDILISRGVNMPPEEYCLFNAAVARVSAAEQSLKEDSYRGVLPYLASKMELDINAPCDGNSPMFWAILGQGDKTVNDLLLLGSDANDKFDGSSPIMINTILGANIEVFDILLAHGADINGRFQFPDTDIELSIVDWAYLRQEGAFDFMYETIDKLLDELGHDFFRTAVPSVEYWRNMGDQMIARIKLRCAEHKMEICDDLNKSAEYKSALFSVFVAGAKLACAENEIWACDNFLEHFSSQSGVPSGKE